MVQPSGHQLSPWHTLEAEEVLRRLQVNPDIGLRGEEVRQRQQTYGPNELVERGLKNPLLILWEQITNPLVLLLIAAAIISAFLGKADSVIAIMAIVVLNALLGLVQEYRAEKAMAALKKMAAPAVRVRRDGQVQDVPARDLVPGDVILLEAGNIVPADARLLESASLSVQEASLTGESVPVDKSPIALDDENLPLGDRRNMVYLGTAVTLGRGSAVIVETGMNTQLGRIAELIQSVGDDKTPLQRRMDELGRVLIVVALVVTAIAFVIGMLTGETVEEVLLEAVAIAVAVVPEGLPAVVTVALALGAQRMLRRRALIRKLPAVETLGSVTVIASDKTGTLTENRMTVKVVDVAGHTAELTEALRGGMPTLLAANGHAAPSDAAQALLLAGSALCNDATLECIEEEDFCAVGDPTEGALVIAAARFGLWKPHLEMLFPRVAEVPFSSERRRMTTIHRMEHGVSVREEERYLMRFLESDQDKGEFVAFTKGAVDGLLDASTHVWAEGRVLPLTADWRERIEASNNRLAQDGLRVLGVAFRRLPALMEKPELVEQELIFVGMVGIIDPPRPEVKQAVLTSREAGIRPVMITGDHPLTALNIARELHIAGEDAHVLTGQDLSRMSAQELADVVEDVAVYARVSPEHKLRIVQALRQRGHIVAMTGDGVNDAPALRQSDIGVAMGITGTAVSKEAADMVILDDNFATIVSAVEEGRTIYDNVRRFVKYLLASNTGELFVLLSTQLVQGMMLPLTTLQILWMNLITDGIPALALGVEKAEPGGMKRPPHAPKESIFGRGLGRHILLIGLLLGLSGLGLGYWAFSNDLRAANGAPAWNTMLFLFLALAQMGHALGVRSHRESLFQMNLLGNPFLLGAVVVTVLLQLGAIYLPFFNNLFKTNPLTLEQLVVCFAVSTVVFLGAELEKLLIRRGVLN